MICIQRQDRTLPFTNPRVKRQSGQYTLRAAEGTFRCGEGSPVQQPVKPVPGKAFHEVEGRPTWKPTRPATAPASLRGAPISAFSWSIRGRFDAGRVNLYAASHREEALSAICARVKSKSCHPLPLLSALTQEARLEGNEPIQTGRSSAAQQETHPAAEQKIGPTTGATPSSSLRLQRVRICKGPLQTQGAPSGKALERSGRIGVGEHQ